MIQLPESKLTKKQTEVFTKSNVDYYDEKADIIVTVRYDDDCGNGHNSFAITCDIYKAGRRGDRNCLAGGCCHEEIAKHFPELAPLIKWHLTSSDGPMHYIANTTYHAKHEPVGIPTSYKTQIKFDNVPVVYQIDEDFINWLKGLENYDLEVMQVDHAPTTGYQFSPKFTFLPYCDQVWHRAPFDTEQEALDFLEALNNCKVHFIEVAATWTEGKEADLEAARSCAVWPEATLEQLTNEETLKARLPHLMSEFKQAVEFLGFIY